LEAEAVLGEGPWRWKAGFFGLGGVSSGVVRSRNSAGDTGARRWSRPAGLGPGQRDWGPGGGSEIGIGGPREPNGKAVSRKRARDGGRTGVSAHEQARGCRQQDFGGPERIDLSDPAGAGRRFGKHRNEPRIPPPAYGGVSGIRCRNCLQGARELLRNALAGLAEAGEKQKSWTRAPDSTWRNTLSLRFALEQFRARRSEGLMRFRHMLDRMNQEHRAAAKNPGAARRQNGGCGNPCGVATGNAGPPCSGIGCRRVRNAKCSFPQELGIPAENVHS